jgi:hypothetical protein
MSALAEVSDEPEGHSRPGSILAPTSEFSWLALTPDQAQILYRVVQESRADIARRWSHGIVEGLSQALRDIDRAGGAYIRTLPSPCFQPSNSKT